MTGTLTRGLNALTYLRGRGHRGGNSKVLEDAEE